MFRKFFVTLFALALWVAPAGATELRNLYLKSTIDTNNSTAVTLTAGAAWTGTSTSLLNWGIVFVNVHADVASSTDGLVIQQSWDEVSWFWTDKYDVPALPGDDDGKTYSVQPNGAFYRVIYTNGASNQGAIFQLFSKLSGVALASSHRIADQISGQDDAELGKVVVSALFDGTSMYGNITATASGNLRVANAEDGLAIVMGDVVGRSAYHKFGKAPDFDITDGFVTVWDGADDSSADQMVYQYSATVDIDSISSSDAGDSVTITIEGLDAAYNYVTQDVVLNGQTRVGLATSLTRAYRMTNVGSTDLAGTVYAYVDTAITAGVPDDSTQIRAIIDNGNNRTLMAIYTIPNGKTGYMRSWYVGTAGAVKTSSHSIQLYFRPFGQVFQVNQDASIIADGTSHFHHSYDDPLTLAAKTDIEMRANTDTNSAGISAGFDIVLQDD